MKAVKFSFLLIATVAISLSACKKHASAISIQPSSQTIGWGDTLKLVANITPSDAIDPVYWTSTDTTIATVDANGEVIGVGAGNAMIIATCDEVADTCKIEVLKATAFELVQHLWPNAWVNETLQISVKTLEPARYADLYENIVTTKIKWRSGDESVVSVSNTGFAKALKLGDVYIYATLDEITDSCRLIVNHE